LETGVFGTLARGQYAALIRLRWHMFTNELRFRKGALELGARTFGYMLYGFTGLMIGAGAGAWAYILVSSQQWRFLPIVFWIGFLIWQMVPVMLASFQEQFDLSILLRFPVGFKSFFLLYAFFGLSDVSTILGGLCCAGIWVGVTLALPHLFLWTTAALGVFAVFNIFLVRAIFAWIDRWLSQRKTREILMAAFMVLALSAQLLNPALHNFPGRSGSHASRHARPQEVQRIELEYSPWLRTANEIQKWLPPGLAAASIREVAEQNPGAALGRLGLLGVYFLAAGLVLAARLKAEYRGENLGHSPKQSKRAARRVRYPGKESTSESRSEFASETTSAEAGKAWSGAGWLGTGTGPITAVMEKELRTLMRSIPQMYVLGAPLLMVFVFGSMFRSNAGGGNVYPLALPICMAYSILGFSQLFSNNLGTEGGGIQLIFLSPTPVRTVLLAKNLFHALLFGVDVLLAGILVSLRLGAPDSAVLTGTIAWLLFALPINLAVGNLFSLTMPYRVNPGRLTRQRGSQANALLSLLAQLAVLVVGGAVFLLCWHVDNLWLATPIFLALAGGAFYVWIRVLRNSDGMANRRRDVLIATMAKTD
jgi:ABC-2 type transport system permease protein